VDCFGVIEVLLPAAAELVAAARSKLRACFKSERIKRGGVERVNIALYIAECDTAYAAYGSREILVNNLAAYTDCLKVL
jgi:hypothetical protein